MADLNVCAVCGAPGFSKSVEHENANLCVVCYQIWLGSGKKASMGDIASHRLAVPSTPTRRAPA